MDLGKVVRRLLNLESRKDYFSRVKEKLEEDGYFVSEHGLIMDRKKDYEGSLGDIRMSQKVVVISPSRNYGIETSRLADFLGTERIHFRYSRRY